MRSFLRPAVLCLLIAALVAPATTEAATAAHGSGPSVAKLRRQVATLRRQNAALQADRALLKTDVATLKAQVTFESVQNATLASTNSTLTANNTALTSANSTLSSEIASAQVTIGGTGGLAAQLATIQQGLSGSTTSTLTADVSALQGLAGVVPVPQTPSLFSASFLAAHASPGADVQSQLTLFLQEFNSGNFATPANTHLTFTVGAAAPLSLGALFTSDSPATS